MEEASASATSPFFARNTSLPSEQQSGSSSQYGPKGITSGSGSDDRSLVGAISHVDRPAHLKSSCEGELAWK